jgi:hypothetical protein
VTTSRKPRRHSGLPPTALESRLHDQAIPNGRCDVDVLRHRRNGEGIDPRPHEDPVHVSLALLVPRTLLAMIIGGPRIQKIPAPSPRYNGVYGIEDFPRVDMANWKLERPAPATRFKS